MKNRFKEPQKVLVAVSATPGSSQNRQLTPNKIISKNQAAARKQKYVMKKHDATHLHYDFRLANNRVLVSFVIPLGPSYIPEDHREAIRVADHQLEYAFSERVIYEGPGKGTVMLWDWGTWEPLDGYTNVAESLRRGILKFLINGEKLKGIWILTRTPGFDRDSQNPYWLLIKEQDSFARTRGDQRIVEEAPNSVSSGRTLEQIAEDGLSGKKQNSLQRKLFEDYP